MTCVSIVLPTYNGAKYIRESIDSVIEQTFSDWELICVDDCSTDSTLSILKEYEKKDSRIRVIHNEINKKLPASLNVGFSVATGEFLTWTSDDNRFRPDAIKIMRNYLKTNQDCFLVYAKMMNMDQNGTPLDVQPLIPFENLFFGNTIGACFMYKREVLETVGDYDIDLFGAEDWDYWLRIAESHPVGTIDEVLYDYRRHAESLTVEKRDFIIQQDRKLRRKHIRILLHEFQYNKEMLCKLFVNYLHIVGYDDSINAIDKYIPLLKRFCYCLDDSPVVIWGAGAVGTMAWNALKETTDVVAFADTDSRKAGKNFHGLPIVSFHEMLERKERIMIAISVQDVYKMILQLEGSNFNKDFYIYPFYK